MTILQEPGSNNTSLPLRVNLIVTNYNGYPAIEIRRVITDMDLIKQIIYAADSERTILALPTFRDKLKARASLIHCGILYEKDNNCFFSL